jgi:branched-chain amino acid transport system ATP-binding protein
MNEIIHRSRKIIRLSIIFLFVCNKKELFVIIKGLKSEGMSIMMVDQNAKKVIDIADKTYLLENGKVVLEGGRDIVKHKEIRRVYLDGE